MAHRVKGPTINMAKYRISIAVFVIVIAIGIIARAMPVAPFGIDADMALNNIQRVIYAGDQDGFSTGGKEPQHSWTNSQTPNPDNEVFRGQAAPENNSTRIQRFPGGEPISPLDIGQGEIVYDDQATRPISGDNPYGCLFPELSVCLRIPMARQIHHVVKNYNGALMMMTEQLTAVNMKFVQIIGSFFDADMHLSTQRKHQELTARAHKDYHPSTQMCRFGTFAKSLTNLEERVKNNTLGLNKVMNSYYTAPENITTALGGTIDIERRVEQFRSVYCDPSDNDGSLASICRRDDEPIERMNADIDYIRTFDVPLTLDINFTNTGDENNTTEAYTDTEEDIVALARNLYWTDPLIFEDPDQIEKKKPQFPDVRNAIAVHNVAHNSLVTIAGLKARNKTVTNANKPDTSGHFMIKMMEELGISEGEAEDVLGEFPSYYAHMEVLTNKIYQNPNFYTNLYDKPANVKRVGVTLDAIKLMHGWDRYESALRREMLTSLLLEESLSDKARDLNDRINRVNTNDF